MYSALLKYNLKVATPRVDIKPSDPMEASCLEKSQTLRCMCPCDNVYIASYQERPTTGAALNPLKPVSLEAWLKLPQVSAL